MRLCIPIMVLLLPIAVLLLAGTVWLAEHDLLLPHLLLLFVAWVAGFWLMRHWLNRQGNVSATDRNWAAHDREAIKLVESHEKALQRFTPEQLADREIQERVLMEMARELARHYHPDAQDPLSPLTVGQLLGGVRMTIDDVAKWLDYYVPGNRKLTIAQLQRFDTMPRWLARILLRKLGYRLIAFYSGRLTEAEVLALPPGQERASAESAAKFQSEQTTIALVGERGSGKAAVIRSLFANRQAVRDRFPVARHIVRYRVQLGRPLARFVVLEVNLSLDSIAKELHWIAEHSDLVVYVCDASKSIEACAAILRTLVKVRDHLPVIAAVMLRDEATDFDLEQRDADLTGKGNLSEVVRPWRERFEEWAVEVVPLVFVGQEGVLYGLNESLVPRISQKLSPSKAHIFLEAIAPILPHDRKPEPS